MSALPSLNYTETLTPAWTVGQTALAGAGTPAPLRNSVSRKPTLANTIANNAAGGADIMLSQVLTIAASGTASIDLTSFTDVNGTTGQSMARLKGFYFEILTPATDGNVVTPASSVDVGAAVSNPARLPLGGTTPTYHMLPGDPVPWVTSSAAGLLVDSTHKSLLFTNNDSVHQAVVLVVAVGGTT